MKAKVLFLFLVVLWFSPNLFCQVLIMDNLFTNKTYYLKPGVSVWVQTKDDPAATYTQAKYVSFDGTNLHFTRGMGKRRVEISVPMQHISNLYIPKNGKYVGKIVLLWLGNVFFASGIAIMAEGYTPGGTIMLLGSFPLLMQSIVIPTKQRIYFPNYDIYSGKGR
ncbi:MAG: hypothetical protein K9I36_07705 [Bacteroidia bacterium]|nr:hypothetical protein [Bacteroidia bacterium]